MTCLQLKVFIMDLDSLLFGKTSLGLELQGNEWLNAVSTEMSVSLYGQQNGKDEENPTPPVNMEKQGARITSP